MTQSSWFVMRAADVPHTPDFEKMEGGAACKAAYERALEDPDNPRSVLYGKFIRFIKLTLPGWPEGEQQ